MGCAGMGKLRLRGGVAQPQEKGRGQWAEFPVLSFVGVRNGVIPVSELPASPGELVLKERLCEGKGGKLPW